MPWAVWITGLPGSGKSTIAKKLWEKLKEKRISAKILRLDEIRKEIVPDPKYTEDERDFVYGKFIKKGLEVLAKGDNLIFDATAHRRKWRDKARKLIKDFIEVYVKCDLPTCIKREGERKEGLVMAGMYRKALERREKGKGSEGLGEVVGVDVPYEENRDAEMVIDSAETDVDKASNIILSRLSNFYKGG